MLALVGCVAGKIVLQGDNTTWTRMTKDDCTIVSEHKDVARVDHGRRVRERHGHQVQQQCEYEDDTMGAKTPLTPYRRRLQGCYSCLVQVIALLPPVLPSGYLLPFATQCCASQQDDPKRERRQRQQGQLE